MRGFVWILTCIVGMCLSACSDDVTSTYSKKNLVQCDFTVPGLYAELNGIVGSYGQVVSVQPSANVLKLRSVSGGNDYTRDATQRYFMFGLGGILVGTDFEGTYVAYDLACPNCDRADRRLSIGENNEVRCGHCKIKYSINYGGVIVEVPEGCIHKSPRGLYRYHIVYDGMYFHIYN